MAEEAKDALGDVDDSIDTFDLTEDDVKPDEHRLSFGYCFWYVRRNVGGRGNDYAKSIRKIGSFFSVEQYWSYYNWLVRPNDLPVPSDLQVFKQGVKPMWEDNANRLGGKWVFRVKKGQASRVWEELLLALVGGVFDDDDLCGIVISTRFQEDIVSLWNADARDAENGSTLKDNIKKALKLPASFTIDYKPHDVAIQKAQAGVQPSHIPRTEAAGSG